jgi:hypothetical protein
LEILKVNKLAWRLLVITAQMFGVSSVAKLHHFYAAPAPGKNFDAAPAPTLLQGIIF